MAVPGFIYFNISSIHTCVLYVQYILKRLPKYFTDDFEQFTVDWFCVWDVAEHKSNSINVICIHFISFTFPIFLQQNSKHVLFENHDFHLTHETAFLSLENFWHLNNLLLLLFEDRISFPDFWQLLSRTQIWFLKFKVWVKPQKFQKKRKIRSWLQNLLLPSEC